LSKKCRVVIKKQDAEQRTKRPAGVADCGPSNPTEETRRFMTMTGKNSWTIAAAVLFAMALLGTSAPARAEKCSLAAAAGKYGFTLNGVAITQAGAVPLAAVGKAILDAAGNVSGSEARSVGAHMRTRLCLERTP
jgi:hypothetical protein